MSKAKPTSARRIVPRATYEQELLSAARTVARLQNKRRSLRRKLREIEVLIRHERKMLRALAAAERSTPRPDVAPSRLFGGAVGLVADADRAFPAVVEALDRAGVLGADQDGDK